MEEKRRLNIEVVAVKSLKGIQEDNSTALSIDIQVGNEKFKTQSSKPSLSWNETFSWYESAVTTQVSNKNQSDIDSSVNGITVTLTRDGGRAMGEVLIPIEELIDGQLVEDWFQIDPKSENGTRSQSTRDFSKSPARHGSLGELYLKLQLSDPTRPPSTSTRRAISRDSSNSSFNSSVSSLNLNSNLTSGGNLPDDSAELAQSMIEVLTKYKCKSEGMLPEDVSATIVECFRALLSQDRLQNHAAQEMEDFILRNYSNSIPEEKQIQEMLLKYKSMKMNPQTEKATIDKILEVCSPSNVEMRELVQGLLVTILRSWGFPEIDSWKFSKQAFTRRYEDGILKGVGLTGWGKKMLPLFSKVVLATGVTVYSVLKDTYIQYIENYFHKRVIFLTKLPNPDYYGRLGGACYDTFLMKMKKTKPHHQRTFLEFVFEYVFAAENARPVSNNKYCISFVKHFTKLEQPFNKEKYISGYNYLGPRSRRNASVPTTIKPTASVATLKTTWHAEASPPPQRINFERQDQVTLQTGNDLSNPTVDKKTAGLLISSRGNVMYKDISKDSGLLRKKKQHVLGLFIVEPEVKFATSLYDFFYKEKFAKIINTNFTNLIDESYDCLIVVGNVFGLPTASKGYTDLKELFGGQVLDKVQHYIEENYFGEMPLYSSFIIPTGHSQVHYIAYTGAYYYEKNMTSSYAPFWSALLTIQKHNAQVHKDLKLSNSGERDGLISTIVTGGFCSPAEGFSSSAKQMYLAWSQFSKIVHSKDTPNKPVAVPKNVDEATYREREILSKVIDNPTAHRAHYESLLIDKWIERREFIDIDEVYILINYLLQQDSVPANPRASMHSPAHDSNKLQLAAASALASYAFPEEKTLGIRNLILNKGGLDTILDLAASGKIQVHQEMERLEIQLEKEIAQGASGKVFKATYNGYDVAVKMCGENFLGFDMVEFTREVAIMSILRHPNVLTCYGACTKNREELLIITEWIPNGSLRNILERSQDTITWPMRLTLAIQMARGMRFLHSLHILHCDLKSSNIMLDESHAVKIIDFGTSRVAGADTSGVSLGTTQWLAPEVFNNCPYTYASDVYSYGIILWEMIAPGGALPWNSLATYAIPDLVKQGERPNIPPASVINIPSKYLQLMQSCWQPNPSKRPMFDEIVSVLAELCEEHHIYL